ncbi:hypothetical protein Pse7367_1460 [Thalassoporum mexicanum PCC 7367]|uniref:ArnT family glycosyltransferase n=1 Tax=Thalassoporum mexicanum TaxID=3457544 RepID=UPI00029FC6FF|nr:glycosyltransferase family 39 protein [Pseudanabaena sp. PCC 7367]AFY69751.1 hypothetical protein Pse7367_1460 [Pseudanabaena sp. PCC 7367]
MRFKVRQLYILLLGVGILCFATTVRDAVSPNLLDDALGWITLLYGAIVIFMISCAEPKVQKALLAAFLARAMLAILHIYGSPLPDSGHDAVMFERIGWEWSQEGINWLLVNFPTGWRLYAWAIALFYTLLGRSELMIQAINVLFGTLVVWNTYQIAKLLWGAKIAVRVAWTTALFPTLMLYSAITMREVAVVYPLTLGIYYLVAWQRSHQPLQLLGALIALVVSFSFHSGILVSFGMLGLMFVLKWLYALVMGLRKGIVRYTVVAIVIVAIAGAIVASGWGLDKFGGSLANLSLESVGTAQSSRAISRASYLEGMYINSPVDLLTQTPIRLVYFLYAPFVWMIRNGFDLAAQLDVLIYVVITISLWRSRRYILRDPAAQLVFALLFANLLVFSLSTSNYGTAIRHRAKFAPLAISLTMIMPWQRKPRLVAPQIPAVAELAAEHV